MQWEDESYDVIDLPYGLPKCSREGFTRWTYPTLIIPNSEWSNSYAATNHTEEEFREHTVKHFVFISMNDLVHVLSKEKPRFSLVDARKA